MTSLGVLGLLCGCLQALDGTLQIIAGRNRLNRYRCLNPKQEITFEFSEVVGDYASLSISALRVAATHVNGNLYLISYTPRLKWLKSITA